MPISQQAFQFVENQNPKQFVFENLTNPAWINRPLKLGLQKRNQ
jgi:hydroxyacyl-ACP dehydratase HTD2-like protein with hotdog domain